MSTNITALRTAIHALIGTARTLPELPRREWLTTRELAALLGRTVDTVKDWRRLKGLSLAPKPGSRRSRLYIGRADLAAWLEQHPEARSRRDQRLLRLAAKVERELTRGTRAAPPNAIPADPSRATRSESRSP